MEASSYWIIDTDYSLDDQIILPYLISKLNVVAITVVGNAGLNPISISNKIKSDLKAHSLEVDVFVGADRPYINYQDSHKDEPIINAYYTSDSIADIQTYSEEKVVSYLDKAAVKIVNLYKKYKNALNILSLGPLTNISLAGQLDFNIQAGLGGLFIGGGSFNNWGNSGNASEYNFRCDPIAAKNVFHYFKTITVIPLEVYYDINIKEIAKTLSESTSLLGKSLKELSVNEDLFLFGVVAGLICANPSLITQVESYGTDIDIIGRYSRGAMVILKQDWFKQKFNKSNYVLKIDSDKLTQSFIELEN